MLTARYTLTHRDGGCDTGRKRFVLQLKSLQGPNPFQGPWAGTTETGEAVTFDVAGGRIENLRARLAVECNSEESTTTSVREWRSPTTRSRRATWST